MSWGTSFKTEIYISRIVFENKGLLEDTIKETERNIERSKQQILMYASASPNDIISDDWKEESISFINIKVNDLIYQIEEDTELLYKLNLLLENFDERITG